MADDATEVLKTEEADPKDEADTEDADQREEPKESADETAKADAAGRAKAVAALKAKMDKGDSGSEADAEDAAEDDDAETRSEEKPPELDERQKRAAKFGGFTEDEARDLETARPGMLEKLAKSQEDVSRKMAEAGRATPPETPSDEQAENADETHSGGTGDERKGALGITFDADEHFISEPLADALNEVIALQNTLSESLAAIQGRFDTEDTRRQGEQLGAFWGGLDPKIYPEYGEGKAETGSDEARRRVAVEEKAAGLRRGFPEMGFAESLEEALSIVAGRTAENRRLSGAARSRGRATSARPPARRGKPAAPDTPEESAIKAVAKKMRDKGIKPK